MNATADPFCGADFCTASATALKQLFDQNGFVILEKNQFASVEAVAAAKAHLEQVFSGQYDLGTTPTKPLKQVQDPHFTFRVAPSTVPSNQPRCKIQTLHMINVWRCDSFFRSVALSEALGQFVAALSGWRHRGCRFAQDQVWVKPPGAGPLSFHRDTTYFDFIPKEVTTVWIALDDTRATGDDGTNLLGALEYCVGSHKWDTASRRGSVNMFFDKDRFAMVNDAARREVELLSGRLEAARSGATEDQNAQLASATNPSFVTVLVSAGGMSIHNGNTWHGSGPNRSASDFRCGVGLHYIPGDARFNVDDLGSLWRPHYDGSSDVPPEDYFPWVCRPAL